MRVHDNSLYKEYLSFIMQQKSYTQYFLLSYRKCSHFIIMNKKKTAFYIRRILFYFDFNFSLTTDD